MQDAKKGVLFDSFPPVLQIQLKRFDYDFNQDQMVKASPFKALKAPFPPPLVPRLPLLSQAYRS